MTIGTDGMFICTFLSKSSSDKAAILINYGVGHLLHISNIDEKCIDQITRAQGVSSKICENNVLFSSVQKCKTLADLCTVIIM